MTVLLFAGESYYPGGGWTDFVGRFGSVDQAKEAIDARVRRIEHPFTPGRTHVPPPPGALLASTSPRHNTVHWVPPVPAWTEVRGDGFDWAQIVVDGKVEWEWHDASWPGSRGGSWCEA